MLAILKLRGANKVVYLLAAALIVISIIYRSAEPPDKGYINYIFYLEGG